MSTRLSGLILLLPAPSFMRVIETSLDEDLSLFSSYLWQERIRHRVFEESGCQVLEVFEAPQADRVREAYEAWSSGRLALTAAARPPRRSALLRWCARYPGLVVVVVAAAGLFPFTQPLSEGQLTAVASWLTIVDLRGGVGLVSGFSELLERGEVWRWFLPVFVHFGPLHVLFNVTVMIYLGSRVESRYGWMGLWGLVVALGIMSNLGQFAMTPNPLFGGLSGVGYGLLGFVLSLQRLRPNEREWQLPAAFSGSLLFFLVLFSTGITEHVFGGVRIANAAHWTGFGTGILLGLSVHFTAKRPRPP